MRNFQQRGRWRNILESWPVLVLLTALLFFFAWGVLRFMGRMSDTARNKKIAEYKVAELDKGKEKLNSDIAKLQTEEGVEETIREKFGLAKEGEGVIVVVEDKNTAEVPEDESGGFFGFLKNWLK